MNRKIRPDAFDKNFPIIRPADNAPWAVGMLRPTQYFKMGKLYISYSPDNGMPAILSMSHNSRYPTWDEVVWVRYKICPNDVDMAMILPPIEDYINYDGGRGKYTFTMEAIKYRGLNNND